MIRSSPGYSLLLRGAPQWSVLFLVLRYDRRWSGCDPLLRLCSVYDPFLGRPGQLVSVLLDPHFKRNWPRFSLPKFCRSSIYVIAIVKFSNSPIQNILNFPQWTSMDLVIVFFFPFFCKNFLHSFFYPSYVNICKNLEKTIVLSSGPFLQIFTFTIQCICSLWWIESSPSEAIPYTQKHDSNKAAAMHLCWNHTTAWVPPPSLDSPHMP